MYRYNIKWDKIGKKYYSKGEYKKSIECYEKALEFDPHDHDILNNLEVIKNPKNS